MKVTPVAVYSGLAAIGIVAAASLVTYRVTESRLTENQRKYQALTLQLSRDQSDLDRSCRQRRLVIEEDRVTRLRALPQARTLVDKHDQESTAAGAKRDKLVAEARQKAGLTTKDLGLARRERIEAIDRDLKAADRKAAAAREEAQRAAKSRFDRTLETIRRRPLEAQPPLRQEAQGVYDSGMAAAEAAYKEALQAGQDARKAAQQAAEDAETTGTRRAREESQWIVDAAQQAYQREVAAIAARFMAEAAALPEGVPIAAGGDQQVNGVNAECDQRLEQLRADFRRAKAELGID